ncbi:unnamed protein product [Ranitomeya imitator]|uniref:Cadherin domain-containing protein n=1 Tax=Ranitomeya imitator TaxID=111125 RepID=A0ABN9LG94_9NEOB|nr:unnamed protein product [Ranitomeya imitator]
MVDPGLRTHLILPILLFVSGQIHYSINEELRKGSIVGNLAKDLELNVKDLSRRKLRIVSDLYEKYFSINPNNGNLYIADRIDRETLCRAAADCVLTFDAVVENPLNIFIAKIDIQDINDNPPKFIHDTLTLELIELTSLGAKFLLQKAEDLDVGVNSLISYSLSENQYFALGEKVSASDEDEGVNAQITYSFGTMENHILQTFAINTKDGEVKTKENLDYEKNKYYEISIEAKDGGGLAAHAKVLIEITDENDNAPEISITSSSDLIPEDSAPGTMVALVKVSDRDSGENGEVYCSIKGDLSFELISSGRNFFKVVTKSSLDREEISSYNITIQASDKGSPEMTSRKVIRLDVSDVNDNAPVFDKLGYTAFIHENNSPGASIFSIQARDLDSEDNAKITYSIMSTNKEGPLSSIISLNPVTGIIYAQQSFDYEKHKEFNIQIIARDNGSPSLNSSITLRICIVDQNDNSPVILYPSPEVDSSTFEMVPWTSEQGSLVSKVVAVDADSGHNAWLSFFIQSSEPSLFTIDQHTGEIRTSRGFQEKDIMKHGIVVLVKDNGIPSRSSSVTLTMVIADHFHQVLPELSSQSNKEESQSNLQFYLVIALALISFFFMLTVIIAVVSKYKESKSSTSFGSLSTSLYPQFDPRFISQFNPGTLPLPYSYDVCVTVDPSETEFAFVPPQHNVPVDSLIDADDSGIENQSLKNFSGKSVPQNRLHDADSVQLQEEIHSISHWDVPGTGLRKKTDYFLQDYKYKKDFYHYISVSGQIHYSINEELRKGSIVGNLAKDLELNVKDLSRRKLRIVSDLPEKYFNINLDNGNLYIADRIDRETLCRAAADCVLTFDAVMENPLNVFSIKINIQDINDNPPTFLHSTWIFDMSESTSPGAKYVLQNAEDLDVGVNSLISYSLSENQYFALGEKVSTDGSAFPELILEKPLDRETQNKHELILTASDGGNPVQTGTALINIIITDFNDNSPVFTQDVYKVSVRENIPVNSTILQVSASDEDEGVNAQITYSIRTTANNVLQMFFINNTNGEITIRGILDYEISKYYDISVQAKDGGGLTAHAKVLLEILDENDNAPEISITSSSDLILEDSPPGSVVALIKVHDRDSGENGEVQCKILGDLPFELISSASNFFKVVTKGSLDREKISSYNITIQASDKGSPEMTSRNVVRLDVSDVNDNAPVFDKFGYTVYVTENNSPGASIFSIQARDLDSEDNAKITYSIITRRDEEDPLSSYISMNPVTGVVYAQRLYDFEKNREFNIQIIATDNGFPSLNSSTTLRICVVDQNDNSPVILYPSPEVDSSTFEMVPWTSEQGSLVSKVVAVDADSGHNAWLSYCLQSPEPSLFTIDQHTGEIRTSRGFHEKDIMKHGIVVLVKDNGIPSRSSSVTLTMVIADHFHQVLPELSSQSNKEESQSNLQFYLVIALALISFFFMLTVIIAVVSKYKESKSSSFGSLSTSLYPQIDPRFISQFNPGTLPLPYSYDVCVTLDPKDLDVGVNSLISYSLSENQYFALGEKVSTDGSVFPELILEKPLDRETQNKHELILTASDGGNPVQTGTALINIIITDFNDNSPVFTQDVYKVSVRENIPVNSTILQVSASDEDEGVNAQITYSISTTASHVLDAFSISHRSGEIKTKGYLDYEVIKFFEILVHAEDGGGLPAKAKVVIEITDENDNAPEISIMSVLTKIPEDSSIGTVIALIKVHDRDSGENGEVQCLITGDLPFKLTSSASNFYKIVTKNNLDREKISSYNITVQASDTGSPDLTSMKVFRLDISDINDNAPVFEKLTYTTFISENNILGASIFSIQARDLDSEDNAKISYSLMSRTKDEPLSPYISMNPVTGVIYAQQSFDFEEHREFNIQIIARDNGSPSLNSSAMLRICIVDQNDNSPVILYPSPEAASSTFEMVPWTSEQGSLVCKVVAMDADSGHNSWLSYFLQSSEPSLFTIDQHTGEIRTSRGFHEKDIMKHGILVLVKDNGISSRSSSVTLTMVIADHFHQVLPELNSPSNKEESQSNLQFYLVIALALISFFFMLTVIIAVVSKYKESKSSFGSLSTSLYPQLDPRFISQFNPGTLPLPYSYDVCVSLDPSEREFAFLEPQHNVPVDSLIDANVSEMRSESETIIGQVLQALILRKEGCRKEAGRVRGLPSFESALAGPCGDVAVTSRLVIGRTSGHMGGRATNHKPRRHRDVTATSPQGPASADSKEGRFPDGNQGKHRVTKRGPALSYPMFTLVTGIVGRWRAVCVTALQRPNSDAAAIRIVVGIAAASLNVKDGNQGKHRVTKCGPALSNPMFTLVTGIVGRWRAVCVTALQRPNSDAAAIRIVVWIAAASFSVKNRLHDADSVQLQEEIHSISHWDVPGTGLRKKTDYFLLDYKYKKDFYHYISVSGQIHYSINEELRKGSIVGNLAKDLDLNVKDLSRRKLRIVFKISEKYFNINLDNGNLYIADRIDRETLCRAAADCVLTFDAVVENPLNIFNIQIDVQDINDNPPIFLHETLKLEISESTSPGRRFVLQKAEDLDVGVNSLISYSLSENLYFALGEKVSTDGSVFPELILEKPLDRETQNKHELILTASDGGNPVQTGTALINIIINDINDNSPVFTQDVYKVSVRENIPVNSTILQVSASDEDEGVNAQITYSFSNTEKSIFETFTINPNNGEINIKGQLDYEVSRIHYISVQAMDGGGLAAHAKVLIEITDENDNAPEISITSSSDLIPEDSPPGTMVALIQVHDRDSGENGEVQCITMGDLPFDLISSAARDLDSDDNAKITYSIMTRNDEDLLSSYISMNPVTGVVYAQRSFDYEKYKEFIIQIIARDNGSPSLNSSTTLRICIVDQNDNSPVILYPSPEVDSSTFEMVPWTSEQGSLVSKVVAVDADSGHNAWLSYFLQSSESSLFSIDQHTGEIRTSRGFHEKDIMKHGIVVLVKDNGIPSRSASVTLTMVIADHFHQVLPELSSQSNKEDSQSNLQFYLVIALALISFFFMLTVIIAVISKYKESKSSSSFRSVSTNLYPQVDPRVLSQFNPGTLPLPYSYDVCVTLDPSEREFAFLKPQHNVPVDSLIDADDSGMGSESAKNCLPVETVVVEIINEYVEENRSQYRPLRYPTGHSDPVRDYTIYNHPLLSITKPVTNPFTHIFPQTKHSHFVYQPLVRHGIKRFGKIEIYHVQ